MFDWAIVGLKKRLLALGAICTALLCYAGEMDVAKEALRDGLWEVARTHAGRIEGDEAKLLILETYAREKNWEDLLKTLAQWGGATGDGFAYYSALALSETGKTRDAATALADARFIDPVYVSLASRLRARLLMDEGRPQEALTILKKVDFAASDGETKMAAAGILAAAGDKAAAEKLWREVATSTNVEERVLAAAAVNLGDADLLRKTYVQSRSADVRRMTGLRLGRVLLTSPDTFAEGAKVVRSIVKDSPDAEGAKDAYLALADTYLSSGDAKSAAECYRIALETWPEAAKISQVQEARGWAFRKLGKHEEAVEAFARAEETATNDVDRASAILEQGDALSDCGRGEEAMAKYRQVLELYPKTPAGEKLKVLVRLRELETKGRDLYKAFKFDEALAVFRELAESAPTRKPRADYLEMLCLYALGKDDEAVAKARLIAEQGADPRIRAEATLWLAKYEYNRRNWKTSCGLFASFADMMPESPSAPSALTWSARAAFAENDFALAIQTVTKLAERYPESPEKARGYMVQGESLIELARFDEAVLVLERAVVAEGAPTEERTRAQMLRADALFAMGADNPARYREALDAYRAVRLGESLTPAAKLSVSFKIGLTLEKLKRLDEAEDEYYAEVVLAYRQGRMKDIRFDDEARAAFSRAAFRLADEYESRGQESRAMHILELVVASDVPASQEAEKRIDRIQTKGKFL